MRHKIPDGKGSGGGYTASALISPVQRWKKQCGKPEKRKGKDNVISPVREINFEDYMEGIPAFLCILLMVCTYSISDGIMFGILSYVLVNLFTGNRKKINSMTWVICALFLLRIVIVTIIKG